MVFLFILTPPLAFIPLEFQGLDCTCAAITGGQWTCFPQQLAHIFDYGYGEEKNSPAPHEAQPEEQGK